MTTPLVDVGPVHWEESYINLFDQSQDALTVPNIDWNLNVDGFEDDPAVVALVDDISPSTLHGVSAGKTPEAKPPEANPPERGPGSKAKAAKKGRPISSPKDSQSAADRRRTQVRLAQRAYRNRKETTIVSLRKDVEDLKARLLGMEGIADELFEITYSSSYLSRGTRSRIQTLRKKQELYRLPTHSSPNVQDNANIPTPSDANSKSPVSSATSVISANRKVLGDALGKAYSSPQSTHPNYHTSHSSPLVDIPYDPQISQASLVPSVPPFGILNNSLLKFSLWLRHAALKGAYKLVERPETPYQVLFEVFRYCIFSCTREELLRHIDGLIQESAKTTYQNMAAMIKDGVYVASDGNYPLLPYHMEVGSGKRGVGDSYLGPEGVTNYLQERGLAIDPDLSYAELTMSSGTFFGSAPTLFDEIRQQRKIRVNVEKLRDELLSRMICLQIGPGIQVSKIDEAIRSTVIAVI